MMTFHPPAPFRFVGRCAKNGDVIQVRITQAAFQQQIGCIVLWRRENFERYTLSLSRYVVPVQALLIFKRYGRLCALLLSEGCEEFLPCGNEFRSRISSRLLPRERRKRTRSQGGQDQQSAFFHHSYPLRNPCNREVVPARLACEFYREGTNADSPERARPEMG